MTKHTRERFPSARLYRASTLESQLVTVLYAYHAAHPVRPNLTEIAQWFSDRYGWMYGFRITARLIGVLLRNDLDIRPGRSCRGTVIPAEEEPKLVRLYRLYGFDPSVPPTERGRYLRTLTWVL